MTATSAGASRCRRFSALQRAEIAEIGERLLERRFQTRFSALQRAEIAEMRVRQIGTLVFDGFSALQRAEIAEIQRQPIRPRRQNVFQCSSTSRNC